MKTLLHICCAPCAIYPITRLLEEGIDVSGFWYNPNIHPYLEYRKRLSETRKIAKHLDIELIERDIYALVPFLRKIVEHEKNTSRCNICYELRLRETVRIAKQEDFDSFTTSLLYSRYQHHDTIREIGEELERDTGIKFIYRDFREGWSEGIKLSRKLKLYRQQYCGCIISEFERFHKTADKVLEHFEWTPSRKEGYRI